MASKKTSKKTSSKKVPKKPAKNLQTLADEVGELPASTPAARRPRTLKEIQDFMISPPRIPPALCWWMNWQLEKSFQKVLTSTNMWIY